MYTICWVIHFLFLVFLSAFNIGPFCIWKKYLHLVVTLYTVIFPLHPLATNYSTFYLFDRIKTGCISNSRQKTNLEPLQTQKHTANYIEWSTATMGPVKWFFSFSPSSPQQTVILRTITHLQHHTHCEHPCYSMCSFFLYHTDSQMGWRGFPNHTTKTWLMNDSSKNKRNHSQYMVCLKVVVKVDLI